MIRIARANRLALSVCGAAAKTTLLLRLTSTDPPSREAPPANARAIPHHVVFEFHERFKGEIIDLPGEVRVELLAHLGLLREKGFRLGRPEVDTLEGSKHSKMKELRIKVLKVQRRFAFAFGPDRKAVVRCGGAKSGMSQKHFYKRLIDLADKRYDDHLCELEKKHG
jgi:hypothetical protein